MGDYLYIPEEEETEDWENDVAEDQEEILFDDDGDEEPSELDFNHLQ